MGRESRRGQGLSRAAPACWIGYQNNWRQHHQHLGSLELKIRFWEGTEGANWARGKRASIRNYKIIRGFRLQEITEKAKQYSDRNHTHEAEGQAMEREKMLK